MLPSLALPEGPLIAPSPVNRRYRQSKVPYLPRINSSRAKRLSRPMSWLINPFRARAVDIDSQFHEQSHLFLSRPLLAPLLFKNETSDARDHCANERTFLSWLRLSIYMSVVSVAIVISFHLKSQPTSLERRFALPFGMLFWLLSLACLASGFMNYVSTVTKYSRRQALVQSGWKTQVVSSVVRRVKLGQESKTECYRFSPLWLQL